MVRTVKIILMFSVGLWGMFGFMSNMLDYSPGHEQVRVVLSMESAEGAPGITWRRVTSPVAVNIGFAIIYLSKLLTAILCLYCCVQMIKFRNADAATFEEAKRWGILGCGVGVVMLFLGFIVFAEIVYEYWRVPTLGIITHNYAFSYIMFLTSFLVILQHPENIKTIAPAL